MVNLSLGGALVSAGTRFPMGQRVDDHVRDPDARRARSRSARQCVGPTTRRRVYSSTACGRVTYGPSTSSSSSCLLVVARRARRRQRRRRSLRRPRRGDRSRAPATTVPRSKLARRDRRRRASSPCSATASRMRSPASMSIAIACALAAAMADAQRKFGALACKDAIAAAQTAIAIAAARQAAGLAVPELPRAWTYVLLCADRTRRCDAPRWSRRRSLRALGGSPDVDAERARALSRGRRAVESRGGRARDQGRGRRRRHLGRLQAAGTAPLKIVLAAGPHVIAAARHAARLRHRHRRQEAASGRRCRCRIKRAVGPARDARRRLGRQVPSPAELAAVMNAGQRARRARPSRRHRRGMGPRRARRDSCAGSASDDGVRPLAEAAALVALVADRVADLERPRAGSGSAAARRDAPTTARRRNATARTTSRHSGGSTRRSAARSLAGAPRHLRARQRGATPSAWSCTTHEARSLARARAARARARRQPRGRGAAPRARCRARGRIEVHYEPGLETTARELRDSAEDALERISADLVDLPRAAARSSVQLVRDASSLRAVAPAGRGAPPWAIGVAYPDLGIISVAIRRGANVTDPVQTLRHELAHIALGAALGRARRTGCTKASRTSTRPSGRGSAPRRSPAWRGSAASSRSSSSTHRSPPRSCPRTARTRRATTSSATCRAAAAGRTRADDGDRWPFRRFLHDGRPGRRSRHRGDQRVRQAAAASCSRSGADDLSKRYLLAPIGLFGLALWVLCALLLVLAWLRKKRQQATPRRVGPRGARASEEPRARPCDRSSSPRRTSRGPARIRSPTTTSARHDPARDAGSTLDWSDRDSRLTSPGRPPDDRSRRIRSNVRPRLSRDGSVVVAGRVVGVDSSVDGRSTRRDPTPRGATLDRGGARGLDSVISREQPYRRVARSSEIPRPRYRSKRAGHVARTRYTAAAVRPRSPA